MAPDTDIQNASRSRTTGTPRASLAAIGASVAIHMLAFLLLAAMLAARTVDPVAEPDRTVGIVLASPRQTPATPFSEGTAESSAAFERSTEIARGIEGRSDSELLQAPPRSSIRLPSSDRPGLTAGTVGSASEFAATSRGEARTGTPRIAGEGDDEQSILEERERLRPRLPTTASTQLSLFGSSPATGRSFVFLIDRSKSMGANGLDAIDASQRELRRALAALNAEHTFQVIVYNFKTQFLEQRTLLPATDENKSKADAFLTQFGGFGATEHDMAIHSALRLSPEVIFVLTDGGDPFLSESQLAGIRQRAAGRTSIYCVQFGIGPNPPENPFLRKLADQNGGSYRYVDRSGK